LTLLGVQQEGSMARKNTESWYHLWWWFDWS